VGKIKKLREMCDAIGANPWIEVDGGITPDNAYQVCVVPKQHEKYQQDCDIIYSAAAQR